MNGGDLLQVEGTIGAFRLARRRKREVASRVKILFVIKAMSSAGGGAERVLSQIASIFAAKGHKVIVLSYDSPDAADFYPLAEGIQRVRLGLGQARPAKLGETIRRMRALRRATLESMPDVVVGFMHSTYIPLGLALLGTGMPVVASEHIGYDHYRTVPLQALLLRATCSLFDVITATAEPVKMGFPSAVRARMVAISNPVIAPKGAAESASRNSRKCLLSVGRLEPQKDHRTLVEAFAAIAGDFPEWDLRIVGEGHLRGELETQVVALGVAGRVALPGACAQIDAEYRAADLYVNSSLYESFGLSTAEALAHGVAAVGFADCPGTNDLIRHGANGVLAQGNPRAPALALALAQLMGSDERRASCAAAASASVGRYSLDRIALQWEDLLTRVTQRR